MMGGGETEFAGVGVASRVPFSVGEMLLLVGLEQVVFVLGETSLGG